MEAVDVVLLYEHIVRELDVACAVKHLAQAQYGIRVEIIQYAAGIMGALDRFRPRVVALNVCYTEGDHYDPGYHAMYDWRTARHFNLAWEQLLYPGNAALKLPRGPLATRHVLHHAWSDGYRDLLVAGGVPAAHVVVNGHPAYALYDQPYRRYFPDRAALAERHGLDPQKRWVFFPENYVWALMHDSTFHRMVQRLVAEGKTAEGASTLRTYSGRSLEEAVRWCVELARNPRLELILRRRPSTNAQAFAALVARCGHPLPPRLRLIDEGTVREWILASDVVLSSWSTSLLEAAIAGRAAFMVLPLPMLPSLAVDWHRHAPKLRSLDETVAACLDADAIQHSRPLAEWTRNRFLVNGDPIAGLARLLAGLVSGGQFCPPPPPRSVVTIPGRFPVPRWAAFEYRRIVNRRRRRGVAPSSIYQLHSPEIVSEREIEQRVERWRAVVPS